MSSIASPGWLSWMNDLVPIPMRGAFWGRRNTVIGIAQFAAIAAGGRGPQGSPSLRARRSSSSGSSSAWPRSRASGCVVFLGIQHDPPAAKAADLRNQDFPAFLRSLPKGGFGNFVLFSVLMTFSVNVMGPLLSIYLLKSRGLDYFSYTAVTMVSMVLSYVAMSYWGPLTDRFGNRRILLVTATALPLLSLGWIFAKSVPAMLVLQVFSGFVWAGVNLATTNFIFDSEDKSRIASTMANFNALNNGLAFAGSITGGLVATAAGRPLHPLPGAGKHRDRLCPLRPPPHRGPHRLRQELPRGTGGRGFPAPRPFLHQHALLPRGRPRGHGKAGGAFP